MMLVPPTLGETWQGCPLPTAMVVLVFDP